MTVHARGGADSERPLGWWHDKFEAYEPNSFVQSAGSKLDEVHRIGQRLHNMNRAVIEKKTAAVPEPQVRASLARQEQRRLAEIAERLAKAETEYLIWKNQALQPFNYATTGTEPRQSFASRVELRQVFSRLDPQQRAEALQHSEFVAAVLEQPPQASGLTTSEHKVLREIELATRYPDRLQVAADSADAFGAVHQALETVELAVANELRAVGQPVIEPAPQEPAKDWA